MITEFIYEIEIEIKKPEVGINLDELKNEMELLECNPNLLLLFFDLEEIDREGNLIYMLEESIESEEDYSEEVGELLDLLLNKYMGLIEEGSRFKYINRNSISSITWIMGDNEWEIYQDIDREYGYGEFEDDSEEW